MAAPKKTIVNPMVSVALHEASEAAYLESCRTGAFVPEPTHAEIAAQLGVPVFIDVSLTEADLERVRRGIPIAEYHFRLAEERAAACERNIPVNGAGFSERHALRKAIKQRDEALAALTEAREHAAAIEAALAPVLLQAAE